MTFQSLLSLLCHQSCSHLHVVHHGWREWAAIGVGVLFGFRGICGGHPRTFYKLGTGNAISNIWRNNGQLLGRKWGHGLGAPPPSRFRRQWCVLWYCSHASVLNSLLALFSTHHHYSFHKFSKCLLIHGFFQSFEDASYASMVILAFDWVWNMLTHWFVLVKLLLTDPRILVFEARIAGNVIDDVMNFRIFRFQGSCIL